MYCNLCIAVSCYCLFDWFVITKWEYRERKSVYRERKSVNRERKSVNRERKSVYRERKSVYRDWLLNQCICISGSSSISNIPHQAWRTGENKELTRKLKIQYICIFKIPITINNKNTVKHLARGELNAWLGRREATKFSSSRPKLCAAPVVWYIV